MKTLPVNVVVLAGIALAIGGELFAQNPIEAAASHIDAVLERFDDPPAPFRPAPLYVWNDALTEEEIVRQLDGFEASGFGGVFVHPRPGLITPYLSDRWFELWRFTMEECKRRGMVAHIYDENSYPSGFAGGHVPDQMPASRQVSLRRDLISPAQLDSLVIDSDTVALYKLSSDEPAGRIRLTVERDGKTGTITFGPLGAARFRFRGDPFEGGIGFRAIVGRNCRIDNVRFYQVDERGAVEMLLADDFERAELGSDWVNENVVPHVDHATLVARIEEGQLVLEHDRSRDDAWLRPARGVSFKGKTTVFEFTLVDRWGDMGGNPALVVGTSQYEPGRTSGAMLIDVTGWEAQFGWGMVSGEWIESRVERLPADDQLFGCEFGRILLPSLAAGETRTAEELGLGAGTYLHYALSYGGESAWLAGKFFVDLLRPGVGEKFIEITLGAYDGVLGDEYGKTVQACFTDEPHVSGAWTPSLPETFERLFAYSILDHLPSIHFATGDWRRVRHDYSKALLELYLENFAKPYYEACDARRIAATGHVWEHGWPSISHGPDVMSFNAWQHIPGIDCLMNQYAEGTGAQFGNYRAVLEIKSIANQFGRTRTLCEAYGAGGWEMTFQDMKRIGDWLLAGGVNLINPHLSYYTIRGARKADHPPSFSYHEPWWEAFGLLGDYLGRLSWALAAGAERNDALVIEPTTTMWMYNWDPAARRRLNELGDRFQSFITELGAAQAAFDLGSEPVMAERGRVLDGRLAIGVRSYGTVILPPGLENLESATVSLLREFVRQGGRVVSCVGVPTLVDGREDRSAGAISRIAPHGWVDASGTPLSILAGELKARAAVRVSAGVPRGGRVFHLVRALDDGALLFVVNTSLDAAARGTVETAAASVELWDPADGTASPVAIAAGDRLLCWEFELAPAGSALFAIRTEGLAPRDIAPSAEPSGRTRLEPCSEMVVTRLDLNVLPLDFVDLSVKGQSFEGIYRYEAQRRIYRAHGFDRNPWDRAVQFEDEILRKDTRPRGSGFTLAYPFVIGDWDDLPELRLVVERGDRYEVSVNGRPLRPLDGEWWLDRSFTVYAIAPEWLVSGRNVIETRASPFSIHHEPEPVYLLGDFALRSAPKGWTVEKPTILGLGAWSAQGHPCYPGRVAYTQKFDCPESADRVVVELSHDWSGVAARVDVNDMQAGYIGWQPWCLDISERLREGENSVTVTVFGSLKNLLGPHHSGKVRGTAWPGHFLHEGKGPQPPGDAYDVIGYGLNSPFSLYFSAGK